MSNGYGRSTGGFGISRDESVNLIVRTCLENGVTDKRQIAFVLATAQHETRNFEAPEEDFGRSQAKKLGYGGGEEYFGRGYVHLTHKENYQQFDKLLGLNGQLVKQPGLATDPEIAVRILVIGMRDGLFTGKPMDRYINEEKHDLYNARRVVNGVTPTKPWSVKAAHDCESKARAWESKVPALIDAAGKGKHGVEKKSDAIVGGVLKSGMKSAQVEQLQGRLNQLGLRDAKGHPLKVDGHFGPATWVAVAAFQRQHGLKEDGIAGPATLWKLEEAVHAQSPMRMDQAGHAGYPMFSQAQAGLQQLYREHGHAADMPGLQAAAGALAAEAHTRGLTQIDKVLLGDNSNQLFAVQGDIASPTARYAQLPTMQALGQSLEQSAEQWSKVQAPQQGQQQSEQSPSHGGPSL